MSGVLEQALLLGSERKLVGVLAEPAHPAERRPVFVFLDAGLVHRVGPNRLHVELARRLAQGGFPSLRFDFSGVGDSRASTSTLPTGERQLAEAGEVLDALGERGYARFVPIGICSGGTVAFELAARDERVVGTALVNAGFASAEVSETVRSDAQERVRARYYRTRLLDPKAWSRVLTGKSNFAAIRRALPRLLGREAPPAGAADSPARAQLAALADRGCELLVVYSEGSAAWDLFELSFGPGGGALARQERVTLSLLRDCDHVITPLSAQAALVDRVTSWAAERL